MTQDPDLQHKCEECGETFDSGLRAKCVQIHAHDAANGVDGADARGTAAEGGA